jgi:hypothetical protein
MRGCKVQQGKHPLQTMTGCLWSPIGGRASKRGTSEGAKLLRPKLPGCVSIFARVHRRGPGPDRTGKPRESAPPALSMTARHRPRLDRRRAAKARGFCDAVASKRRACAQAIRSSLHARTMDPALGPILASVMAGAAARFAAPWLSRVHPSRWPHWTLALHRTPPIPMGLVLIYSMGTRLH